MVFNFGKYKGQECDNLQYLAWVFGNVERQDIDYQRLANEICDQQVEYFGGVEFSTKIMLLDRAFFWEKFQELWLEVQEGFVYASANFWDRYYDS